MKLTTNQANALKTWCNGAVIEYMSMRYVSGIGSARTISSLCKRGLICKMGFVTPSYKLTALGVSELRLRGFFTRPPGATIE